MELEARSPPASVRPFTFYLGRWLKPAKNLVDAHAGELAERPTWLFSSGPIDDWAAAIARELEQTPVGPRGL